MLFKCGNAQSNFFHIRENVQFSSKGLRNRAGLSLFLIPFEDGIAFSQDRDLKLMIFIRELLTCCCFP